MHQQSETTLGEVMWSRNATRRTSAAVAGTIAISCCGLIAPGVAAANPLDELLNIIRQQSKNLHVPADEVVERSRLTLGPAASSANEDSSQFLQLRRAACRVNDLQHQGLSIDATMRQFPWYQRQAIWNQVEEFDQLQRYDDNGYSIVKLICNLSR